MFRDGKLAKLWWEPVRRAVLNFAGVPKDVQDIGIKVEADAKNKVKKPTLDDKRPFKSTTSGTVGQDVVITYISRQGVRRHLIDQDHENLVFALEELCAIKGWELNIVQAERLSKEDQLALVAKTTVCALSVVAICAKKMMSSFVAFRSSWVCMEMVSL